jgi:hypothetical protein
MAGKLLQKYSVYSTVIRLWVYLVLTMIIIVFMFPIQLPMCGNGNTDDNRFRFRDFYTLVGTNAVAGSQVLRLRSWFLFLLAALLAIVLVSWAVAHLFSIELRRW